MLGNKRVGERVPRLAKRTIGNATVVHLPDRVSEQARSLAMWVAADPHHDLVVVDLPPGSPISLWESVARALPKRRRGIRLVVGGRAREATALAGQWLAERLGRSVVVPDGVVHPCAHGGLFVHSGRGSGWLRLRPGKPPRWEAKRFPQPRWDCEVFADDWPTGARGVAEPIPGGMWIRPVGAEAALRAHRARLLGSTPCQDDVVTLVLGCPGAPPVTRDDIARMWVRIPPQLRERVRFAQFGPVAVAGDLPLGQVLADWFGEPVACYTGLPVATAEKPAVYTVGDDGVLGWHAFAEEVGYSPTAADAEPVPPTLLRHRPPVFGAPEVAPAVYWYAPDAVIEVVPAGLWVRRPTEGAVADAVRAARVDRAAHILTVDTEPGPGGERMRQLAEDVLARLDPLTRRASRVRAAHEVAASWRDPGLPPEGRAGAALDPAPPAPRAPADAAALVAQGVPVDGPGASWLDDRVETTKVAVDVVAPADPAPVDSGPGTPLPLERAVRAAPVPSTSGAALSPVSLRLESGLLTADGPDEVDAPIVLSSIAHPADEPDTEPAGEPPAEPVGIAALQTAPDAAASALLPESGVDEERAWLRRTLGPEYGIQANAVSRVLSEHPGFQGVVGRSTTDVVTDAVAVRLYLTEHGHAIDLALRTGSAGPHVPFARCAVSGLNRLPSHRGASVVTASPTPEQFALYRESAVVTEWGFLHALTAPCSTLTGDTDVVIWSMSARRTKLLEPPDHGVQARVLFVPGSAFKVLRAVPAEPGTRGLVMLRELAYGEIDDEGRVDTGRGALDELAAAALDEQRELWTDADPEIRIPPAAASRFGALPGLA